MRGKKPDKWLIIVVLFLLLIGLGMLLSASLVVSQEQTNNPYHYFVHQLIYGGVGGLILFFIVQKIDYKIYKKLSLLIFFLALILCVLVFVPQLGMKHGGAQRWLILGPINFQPSEFLKLALIIYLATFFSKKEVQSGTTNTLVPFLAITAVVGGLIALQNDAGTLGLIVIVGFVLYFLGGAKIPQIVIVILVYLAGLFALIKFFPHRMERLMTFLNPSTDPQGISYQINQALLAIGSGGLFGRGPGHSIQKYNYLPEPMNDSVFAIMAEEIGFVGCVIFLILILMFVFKGLKIGHKVNDGFGKLLACGIASWIGFQTLINISAISGIIPLTGIPLPFVSYGSSALIITMVGAGILVNISKHQN